MPPFNPLASLYRPRRSNGARNERSLFAKYDEEEQFLTRVMLDHESTVFSENPRTQDEPPRVYINNKKLLLGFRSRP